MPQVGEIARNKNGQKQIWHACEVCGKERWVNVIKGKPISIKCRICANRALRGGLLREKAPRWKGGRIKRTGGYIIIRVYPNDFFYPMATKDGYVFEHRLVMAKHLSRCLLPWEVVHHKNGIRDDNRLENLKLLPDSSKHFTLTKITNYIRKLEKRIQELESR